MALYLFVHYIIHTSAKSPFMLKFHFFLFILIACAINEMDLVIICAKYISIFSKCLVEEKSWCQEMVLCVQCSCTDTRHNHDWWIHMFTLIDIEFIFLGSWASLFSICTADTPFRWLAVSKLYMQILWGCERKCWWREHQWCWWTHQMQLLWGKM